MDKKRILVVSQEMQPYTLEKEISKIASQLPLSLYDGGYELRVLMPRFGLINERRHRLHEVVRLSGMNIIIDDDDYPLIIKVASLPNSRLQVYFLDNEDFFKRKYMFEDNKGKPFVDNEERMVFYNKGALEIVKKFGWAPDIVHCNGWMTSLVPFYLKTVYKNDPIFKDSKVVYNLFDKEGYDSKFGDSFLTKAAIEDLTEADLKEFMVDDKISVERGGATYADAIVKSGHNIDPVHDEMLSKMNKPFLEFNSEGGDYEAFNEFYQSLIEEEVQ